MSPVEKVVVDGSNIATEGRPIPSLQQLDEAVRSFISENPGVEVIVIVDATFGHRIDASERPAFDEAVSHGEMVSPPAGAIGRGDAFLLQIADKVGATVLSNDSFQEFHGTYEWLFETGRLIGGKPIPGIGWIFTPRTPVRGPKSRESVRDARRGRARIGSKQASVPMPTPTKPPPKSKRPSTKQAIAEATKEAVSVPEETSNGDTSSRRRRRRRATSGPPAQAVNDPLTFIKFIAEHQLGSRVEGEVESFSSHGAFVVVNGARCYIPLSAMGDPPPRSARTVMHRGDTMTFVVQALDAPRRGVELALPGFERIAGAPTDETVEAEISDTTTTVVVPTPAPPVKKKAAAKKKATVAKKKAPAAKKVAAARKKEPAKKKAAAVKKAVLPAKKKTVVKKAAPVKKKAPVAKKKASPAKKVAAKTKAAVKKVAPTKKKTAAKKAPAKKKA